MSEFQRRLVGRALELVHDHPPYGYRQMWALLRREERRVNRKRLHRLWRREGLKVPRKQRKRRHLGQGAIGCVRRRAEHKDHVWAWDFVDERRRDGRPLKWLTFVDEYTRENLALEVGRGMTAEDVIDVSAELFVIGGVPEHIHSHNGPEFIAAAIRRRLEYGGVQTPDIEPGSPWENGHAESFHSRLQDELLAGEEFENVAEARGLGHAVSAGVPSSAPAQCVGVPDPGGVCRRLRGFGLRYAQPSAAQQVLSIAPFT